MGVRNLNVISWLGVMVISPSIQKYAVGPLVRLGINSILYALVGRSNVLVTTCCVCISPETLFVLAYIKEPNSIAASMSFGKVSR